MADTDKIRVFMQKIRQHAVVSLKDQTRDAKDDQGNAVVHGKRLWTCMEQSKQSR